MTTSQDQNSRIETRLDLEETIFIEIIASDSSSAGSVLMCNSLDLSANGLQVIVDEEISMGSILRLCIDFKDADPIFLVGEVKWKRPDEESGAYRIGFLLFEAEDTDIQRWKELVARLLGSKP
ncbi:MAG: PilZ domain-containing protein [Gammaproteobacteria bacterium]|jgi:hypothetical protein|nr:PilZ domain-containing protein [Gammaproteobacteria bacterium]MBT4493573.1 PilZ domain-containing protein [Gammaproteobacteria bacterium]MBT7371600.1 PilZ domain-containing protein [Gammaproteobacteria bacterium]